MKNEKVVLAIDPGTVQSAYVVWDGTIREKGILPNEEMRDLIYFGSLGVDQIVIEMVEARGMPVGKETFETVLWTGRFQEAAVSELIPVTLVYRRQIKIAICGSAKATDANIRQALLDIVGPQGTKKEPGPTYRVHADVWSALAVAVAWRDLRGFLTI